MDIQLFKTEDGSHTIFNKSVGEHYHSVHGAIQESMYVFIQSGFNQFNEGYDQLAILEVGFGTGLNALLTFIEAQRTAQKVRYIAVEPFPVEETIYSQLNYPDLLKFDQAKDVLSRLHKVPWNVPQFISDQFIINKMSQPLQNIQLRQDQFNVIYFDAFSSAVQPELWTVDVFESLYSALTKNGILVTYAAKGEFKRMLKRIGFVVESIPGPPGKREITRARK